MSDPIPVYAEPEPDDVRLVLGSTAYAGWQGVRVTRGLERFPSDFDLTLTERYPGSAQKVPVTPGTACQVYAGTDLLVSGYVDRLAISLSAGNHALHLSGRGRCQDLIDCTIDTPGCGFVFMSLLDIATKLAAPYGIAVRSMIANLPRINALSYYITQTPYEVIGQMARFSQAILYEAPDGALVIDQAGTARMASGLSEGANVESASVLFDMSERMSEYRCYRGGTDFLLKDVTGVGPVDDPNLIVVEKDAAGVVRHRVLSFVAEQGNNAEQLAQRQALWELNRRRGRSQAITVTADAWRDAAGKLWQPNALAHLDVPTAKVAGVEWLISEVTFRKDEGGTHADLVLMPPESFQPQPTNLFQFDPNIMRALSGAESAQGQGGG